MSRLFLTDEMKSHIRRRVKVCAVQKRPSFFVSYNFARFSNPEKSLSCRQEYSGWVQVCVAELNRTYQINDDQTSYDPNTGWLNIVVEMVVVPNTGNQPTRQTIAIQKPKGGP